MYSGHYPEGVPYYPEFTLHDPYSGYKPHTGVQYHSFPPLQYAAGMGQYHMQAAQYPPGMEYNQMRNPAQYAAGLHYQHHVHAAQYLPGYPSPLAAPYRIAHHPFQSQPQLPGPTGPRLLRMSDMADSGHTWDKEAAVRQRAGENGSDMASGGDRWDQERERSNGKREAAGYDRTERFSQSNDQNVVDLTEERVVKKEEYEEDAEGSHVASKEISNENKHFECSSCGDTFASSRKLYMHVKIYGGSCKPFICPMCGLTFDQNTNYKVHMRSHKGDKPFICSTCDYSITRSNLKAHMRTHTGERPYQCSLCASKFSQRGNLEVHVKSRHVGEPFDCSRGGSRSATLPFPESSTDETSQQQPAKPTRTQRIEAKKLRRQLRQQRRQLQIIHKRKRQEQEEKMELERRVLQRTRLYHVKYCTDALTRSLHTHILHRRGGNSGRELQRRI
eukprot:g32864.t1